MNNSFVLALGLAAIDGLTSAFVAMLILALSVIGSGQPAELEATSDGVSLLIRKPSIKFLVMVEPVCGGPNARRIPQNQPSTQRLREIENQTNGGTVYWIDTCSSDDEACSAQLLISRPRGKSWRIYLANSTTQKNFTEGSLGSTFEVKMTLITSSGQQQKLTETWALDDAWHGFDFSVSREGPHLQKVLQPFRC